MFVTNKRFNKEIDRQNNKYDDLNTKYWQLYAELTLLMEHLKLKAVDEPKRTVIRKRAEKGLGD